MFLFHFKHNRKPLAFLIVLFCINAIALQRAFPADGGSGGVFTDEEEVVSTALKEEFKKMGARCHILKGTILYLYHPHRSKYYNINSLGFRGEEVKPKKKNEFHIMIMGASTVFGSFQADSQAIPALLEGLLQAKHPDRDIHVYNLGVEGYEFKMEIALAKRLRKRLNPDLIIFYNGGNDLIYSHSHGYAGYPPLFNNKEDETFFARKNGVNVNFFALQREWRSKKLSMKYPNNAHEFDANRDSFVKGYLKDAKDVAKYFNNGGVLYRGNIPVLFVIQPTVYTRSSRTLREQKLVGWVPGPNFPDFVKQCVTKLNESAQSEGVAIHDFTVAFDGYEVELFSDIIHINVAGNKIITERLAGLIQEGGYLNAINR